MNQGGKPAETAAVAAQSENCAQQIQSSSDLS